jgi:hypothetical protein
MMLAAAAEVSGRWEVESSFDDRLTGSCSDGTASLTGEVDGQLITWRLSNVARSSSAIIFTGTINDAGNRIDGRFTSGDQAGRFVAAKQ